MTDKYILDGREAVPCHDLTEWGTWFENADRHVAKDEIGDVKISTIFLGLDHSFGQGPPLLFETMVFGGDADGDMDRYSTWEEAEQGHAAFVTRFQSDEGSHD